MELITFTILAGLLFAPLGSSGLWDRREEHLAAEALEGLLHGRWLIPLEFGQPRLKKPPLTRWLVAGSITLWGDANEASIRFPSGVATFFTALMLYALGCKIASPRVDPRFARGIGLLAAVIYTTNFFVLSEVWVMSAEPILACFITLASLLLLRALSPAPFSLGSSPRPVSLWWSAAGIATGLAALVKGPIAWMFVLIPLLGVQFSLPRGSLRRPALRDWLLLGSLATMPIAVWGCIVLWHHPHATQLWLHEMAIKVAGPERRPPLVIAFLPMASQWVIVTLAGFGLIAWRSIHLRPLPVHFAWWWCVGNLVAMSLWTSARPPYFLACMPGSALLAAAACLVIYWDRPKPTHRLRWRLIGWFQGLALVGTVVAIPVFSILFAPDWLWMAFVLSTGTLAFAFWSWQQHWHMATWASLLLSPALAATVAGTVTQPCLIEDRCHRRFCQHLNASIPPDVTFLYLVDQPDWPLQCPDFPDLSEGFWFYLQRPPELAGNLDQLAERIAAQRFAHVLLSPRQADLLRRDGRFQVQVLADESQFGRKKTLLTVVRSAAKSTCSSGGQRGTKGVDEDLAPRQ